MDRLLDGLARGIVYVAAACFAAMMLLTVADVALRAALNVPIRGVTEMVELLLACAFFVALPAAFVRDEHLVVDSIDGLKPSWVAPLKRLSALLAAIVLATMAWQGWIAARDTIEFGDLTPDLSMPRVIYWIPVLFGMVSGAVVALVLFLRGFHARDR